MIKYGKNSISMKSKIKDKISIIIVFLGIIFSLSQLAVSYKHLNKTSAAPLELTNTPESYSFSLNNPVNSVVVSDDGYTYVGGDFTHYGPPLTTVPVFDASSGSLISGYPSAAAGQFITEVISDGAGGWYVAGSFSELGGVSVNKLAHILPDKSVDSSWNPSPNNYVESLYLDGTTLYVGGFFSNIDGQSRNYIAAFDTTTGNLTSWNPLLSGYCGDSPSVKTMESDGTNIYLGGSFSQVNGNARPCAASVLKSDASITTWNPNLSGGSVYKLIIDGSNIYLAGFFTTVGGNSSRGLARVDNVNGSYDAGFTQSVSNYVRDMELSGTTLYVGGYFTTVGGVSRTNLVAINTSTNSLTSWNPDMDTYSSVYDLEIDGSTLYATGNGLNSGAMIAGGVERTGIIGLNTSTALPTSWDPGLSSSVESIAIYDSEIFLSTESFLVDATQRKYLLELDSNGDVTDFDAQSDGPVNNLIVDNDSLFVVGAFSTIGGEVREDVAKLDRTTGLSTSWNTNQDNKVYAMGFDGDSTLYISGNFSNAGGQVRQGFAGIDTTTGLATDLDIALDDNAEQIIVNGNSLYIVGYFSDVNGSSRNYLAEVDLTTGLVTDWNPANDGFPSNIAVDDDYVYVVGWFDNFGGVARKGFAQVDRITGLSTDLDLSADDAPSDIILDEGKIFLYGGFSNILGENRSTLASYDLDTGLLSSWNPEPNEEVYGFSSSDDSLYVFGSFNAMGSTSVPYFAKFVTQYVAPTPTPTPTPASTPTPTPEPEEECNPEGIPPSAPDLYQIDTTKYTATLYVSPGSETSSYEIKYYQSHDYAYRDVTGHYQSFTYTSQGTGAQSILVENLLSGRDYIFEVRARNDCMVSSWITKHAITKGLRIAGLNDCLPWEDCWGGGNSGSGNTVGGNGNPDPIEEFGDDVQREIEDTFNTIKKKVNDSNSSEESTKVLGVVLDLLQTAALTTVKVATASAVAAVEVADDVGPINVLVTTSALTSVSFFSQFFKLGKKYSSDIFMNILHALGFIQHKNPQGIVYDTLTNKPIPFALLTINSDRNDSGTNILETVVTDVKGIYHSVKLIPGIYNIVASHQDYIFPTKSEKPALIESEHFYKGELFAIDEGNNGKLFEIPLDKRNQLDTRKSFKVRLNNFADKFNIINLFWPLFIFSIASTYLYPTVINIFILGIQFIFVVKKVLLKIKKPNLYGVVKDENNIPVEHAIVRIKNLKNNELISIVTTDKNGKFKVFVDPDKYQFEVYKAGYIWKRTGNIMSLEEVNIDKSSKEFNVVLSKFSFS